MGEGLKLFARRKDGSEFSVDKVDIMDIKED